MPFVEDFREHPESCAVVKQALDPVFMTVGEDVQRLIAWINAKLISCVLTKCVDAFSKINRLFGNIDAGYIK